MNAPRPNVVFVFGDEWRAQATGYNGDTNCSTPVLDELAAHSIDISRAVAGTPVCCPYRASLMTGQYPLTHGVYINDVPLRNPNCISIARAFGAAGYRTAYIGKWHIYGSPDGRYGRRAAYVPRDHQLGFDYWKGFECNHDYNDSRYFFNDDPTPRAWEGYDAFAQSRDAAEYIRRQARERQPFLLMLSWGPPHFPLHTAPPEYRARYADRSIALRPNVPPDHREKATADLRGYYAHIAALDDCLAIVRDAVRNAGIERDTIFVFTSDHGDMRESQGLETKLFPWDESIRVPFLLRWPALHGDAGRALPIPLDAPDIMPTLLDLCGAPVPEAVEGRSLAPHIRGECAPAPDDAALLAIHAEFTELRRTGIPAYRGLRTARHTYVRTRRGPWLFYDNDTDPYQMRNLAGDPQHAQTIADFERRLASRLAALKDEFLDGRTYLERDGLTHYGEVNNPCTKPWSDPWISAGSSVSEAG